MKVLSWNIRGLGGASRRLVVKELLRSQKVQIAMLQELKLKGVSDRLVKEIWGRRFVKWVAVDAVGAAGRLLMWDTRSVSVLNSWKDVFSLPVLVEDLENNSKWLLTSVYGQNNS
eukprot:TRINITY_DN10442_c1_g1_i1.p1 TRINITY_DN10442_c1_g1~~TRINITY_DN10442_c1_g1_i1.p1  ORF type:complete len:115 (-),score=26.44 TRINITY_DN10442_c1_g1_i1:3-347(-)